MPTNSVYENLFYGINEIPLFTYGMLGITTVVLAYFTMYDIESASGEEGDSAENEKTEVTDSEKEEEEEEEKREQEEEKEEGPEEKQPETPSGEPTNILETTTGNPMAELKNLTQDISKSISPEVAAKEVTVVKAAEPAKAVESAEGPAPVKPSVGGNKKRKTKRANKSNKKTTRNHRKHKQPKK